MRFFDVLLRVTWLLLTEHIVSYRRIESEFDLDGSALEDIRRELIQIKRWAVDRDGEHLVWVGTAERLSSPSSAGDLAPIEPLTPVRDTERAAQFQDLAPAASPAETTPPTAETPTASALSSDAERRPLTVMFCDMADSTALSTKLDPEDLQLVATAADPMVADFTGDGRDDVLVSTSGIDNFFGDGVYEVIPVYSRKAFRMEEHLRRLRPL